MPEQFDYTLTIRIGVFMDKTQRFSKPLDALRLTQDPNGPFVAFYVQAVGPAEPDTGWTVRCAVPGGIERDAELTASPIKSKDGNMLINCRVYTSSVGPRDILLLGDGRLRGSTRINVID